ncbi:MAG: HEPN domain-containing protein [Deltaproteobacteria bacterium]|nr:HEPN domain-containing protein [Deltaproteobacteria bacterium]
MKKEVKNWLDSAEYDLETAKYMFDTGRYIYTIFMCHLALEKVLKARIQEITGKTPAKSHNLRYLVKLSNLKLPEDMFEFLSKLSNVSIPTRYPEDFRELMRAYNKEVAKRYLNRARGVFEWIKKSLNL